MNMLVAEQVAIFLHIISHHLKNRVTKHHFNRSGETVSRSFHNVLNAIIHLQDVLFKKAEPITVNSTDPRWKWFKNFLDALDGTHIKIRVPTVDKPRYQTRKGDIATNMLGVCTPNMQFVYVLPGWEGSVADGRVLQDAISRRHGLKVPHGCYYLVDAGYTNCEGFLAPFRGQRYNLNEWRQGYQQSTPEEFFNMKHASTRNVIKRCFGLLKLRWGILKSPSFYPSHKEAAQFRYRSFPYYDQLTAIYVKDRTTGKDAQTAADIIEEIDVEDIADTNTHEERNDFHGCEADVSLDDMDLSATQPQPARNQELFNYSFIPLQPTTLNVASKIMTTLWKITKQ
ncbi:uncharacterized protein LOC108476766 [Gossypium arboreum]|uniref:uncharacterized protein LOC108476766 n=1 Tax=Gossypium arboreum TaxID=29729 RepID=UPI0022F14A27|nr:uncharacterized protein LOC108476766 [Gossypium arboreum]